MPTRGRYVRLSDPSLRMSPVRRRRSALTLLAVALVALLGAATVWGASVVVHAGFAVLHNLHDTAADSTCTRPGGER